MKFLIALLARPSIKKTDANLSTVVIRVCRKKQFSVANVE